MGRLDQFNDTYKDTAAVDPNAPVADGVYETFIVTVYLTVTKQTNRDMLRWELSINTPGPYQGRKLFASNFFDSPDHLGHLKADLEKVGCGAWRPSDLENTANLKKLSGLRIEVRTKVSDKSGFQNVYLRKLLDGTGPLSEAEALAGAGAAAGAGNGAGAGLDEAAPF